MQRDPDRLWCGEHGRYEDECAICHPELLVPEDGETHDHGPGDVHAPHNHGSTGGGELMCPEHDLLERECGICHPELMANLEPGQGMKIRLASARSVSKAGIRTGHPGEPAAEAGLTALGRVTFDRNKLASITPLAGGVVLSATVDVGDQVESGQVLAQLHSLGLAEAKTRFVQALGAAELCRQTLQREKDLHAREISARQDLEAASAAYEAAQGTVAQTRQALLNLGLSEGEVGNVSATRSISAVLPVRAPFSGTVVRRAAVAGEAVEPGAALFEIADLSSFWIELSIGETHIAELTAGMPVQARFDTLPGEVFEGELVWIAPRIDERTRLIEARALLPNRNGLLRDGMFGRAHFAAGDAKQLLSLPKDAVQVVDGRDVVFARIEDNLFEARVVDLGPGDAGTVVIRGGIDAHDEVVLAESHVLKSELLKARLGAGCVHD